MLPGNPPQLTKTKHKLEMIRLDTTRERLAWKFAGTSSRRLAGMYERDDRNTLINTLLPNRFLLVQNGTMMMWPDGTIFSHMEKFRQMPEGYARRDTSLPWFGL